MAALPPGNLVEIEAPILVAGMLACPLYGLTLAQAAYYVRSYPDDKIYLKALVAICVILETAHLALVLESAHFFTIVCKLPENIMGLFLVRKSFAISFLLTILITALVQAFYALRVWRVNTLHPARRWLVAVVAVLCVAQVGVGLASDALLQIEPQLTSIQDSKQKVLFSLELSLAVICDVLISAALVYFLRSSRTGYQSTENMINRLIIYSVNTGLVTSAMSIVILILYFTITTNTLFALFLIVISKVYVISLLVTLNSRNHVRELSESTNFRTLSWRAASGPGLNSENVELSSFGPATSGTLYSESRGHSRAGKVSIGSH